MLTILHSERPKLHRVLAVLSAMGLKKTFASNKKSKFFTLREASNKMGGKLPLCRFSHSP